MVLIADDDRDIVRFVEVNLRLEGYEVITAHDGQDALAKALEVQPNLILLDVMMPLMDGFEVCTKLRDDGRSAHIPVIMLTAKSLSADKVLGLTAGADDYIIKPFDPMELIARVKTTLRRASEMRSLSPLTGLPGNNRIEQEISHRMELGMPVAVAYADLDNFKSYNDRYGHGSGDEALRCVGRVLHESTRADDVVARYGGEEFVVLMGGNVEDAIEVAERVRHGVEHESVTENETPLGSSITVSVGVAGLTEDVSSLEQLVEKADDELYRAKRAGKNRVAATGRR
jgi:diguanylate cyclase (GGDEF)-like protein